MSIVSSRQVEGQEMTEAIRLFEDSPVAFYTCNREGYLSYYNPAAERLWGRAPQIGKDLWCGSWKIYYPDGTPMQLADCPMAKTLKTGKGHENERITIERPDGSVRQLLVFPRPFFDGQNRLAGAQNTLVDISDHMYVEERQNTLSAIVESSDDAIISKNLNGTILSWNRGAQKIFGYREEEVIGKSITILIPEERLDEETHIIGKIKSGQKLDHFETIRLTKDGRKIPISLTVSPLINSRGEIVGASKIARDISAQVKAQAEIKKYAQNLEILNSVGKSISENMDAEVILQRVTDATTQLTGAAFGAFFYKVVNEEGEALMLFTLSGAPREAFEKFGMPGHTEVFHPTFTGEGVLRVDDITKDKRYGKSAPHFGMPKGHLPVVSFLSVPVVSTSGEVIGGLFFGHPEAGRFSSEHEDMVVNIASQAAIALDNSRLFEQVRLLSEKKDEFIALASHELRTPLTTISGYIQMLAQEEQDEMTGLFLKKSLQQVNKLNTLVEDMLHMSRIEAGRLEFALEVFDIRQVLLDLAETFAYSHQTHQLKCDLTSGPVKMEGDRQRIEQAITNILNNAVKYSPGADTVYLKLETTDEEARVRIKDEGIGLDQYQQQHLFTRFYRAETTKGISGLGLGLYLTRQIIDRHGGKIKVNSKLGEGSEFSIILPFKQAAGRKRGQG